MSEPLRIAADARELEVGRTGISRFLGHLLEAASLTSAPLRFELLGRRPPTREVAGRRATQWRALPGRGRGWSSLDDWSSFRHAERSALREGRAWDAFLSPYYKLPRGLRCPAVCVVHDLIPLDYGALPYRRYFEWRMRDSLARAEVIVTVSEHSRSEIARRFRIDPERVLVAPNACSPSFRPDPQPSDVLARARYGIPDAGYLLALASAAPHKNLARLVAAYVRLPREWRQRHPLVLCTSPDDLASLGFDDAGDFGVRAIGRVREADLAALYRGARLLVVASLAEGFGLPALEAMACGTVVALSRAGSLPEVAGPAAFYFDPCDADAIGTTLVEAAASPERHERRALGLVRAGGFRLPETLQPLLERLESLAGRQRGQRAPEPSARSTSPSPVRAGS